MTLLVNVPADHVLTVTADAGGCGTVWEEGTNRHWHVGDRTPLRLGAGLYRVVTIDGRIDHSVDSLAIAALNATLPRATAIVATGAIIAEAINRGSTMAIADRFKRLAERAKSVPLALGERADAAFARLDSAEQKAGEALTRIEVAVVSDAEAAAREIEDVANQLSNGAPNEAEA
jgi:hypothetical protein